MHFTEEETALLKTWVIKKLEDISDADADVLADYALALVSTEDTRDVARANCVENLRDFLPNNAEQFVDELFTAIATKTYDPSQSKPKTAPRTPQIPTGPKDNALEAMNASRKRSFQRDREDGPGQNGQYQGGNRPMKQLRRGGQGGFDRDGRQQQRSAQPFAPQQFSQPLHMNNLPSPQALPQLDPNDPVAMFALQQFMGAMTGMQTSGSPPKGMPFRLPGSTRRCRDYDMKGFCAVGASCPFDHGNEGFVLPTKGLEYDPANAMLNVAPQSNGGFDGFNGRGRSGMRGRGQGTNNFRGGGKRSDFSVLGPSRASTNTSIVVEQIPHDKLDEETVREFFSEFGEILEIVVHSDRKLAIVKYETKTGAKAAYESPKVVFDNRFVKVYWYNSEKFEQQHSGTPAAKSIKSGDVNMQVNVQIDHAGLARRQEEAQRKHDEARRQRDETEKQKATLDQKLKAMEAERKEMADLLVRKSSKGASPALAQNGGQEESEQTSGLRAQLAKLEAEAKELGIDPDAPETNGYDNFGGTPHRGRGGFRGRGRGRGRGFYQPYRGGWGGSPARCAGVMRLDNRPKTIAVSFTNDSSYDANDEALRQFLLFNSMEATAIAKHPDKDDTALITFEQRFEGENFMLAARSEIPHAGKVEASWYAGAPSAGVKVEEGTNGTHSNGWTDVKMEREGDANEREMYDSGEREEQDLDRFA